MRFYVYGAVVIPVCAFAYCSCLWCVRWFGTEFLVLSFCMCFTFCLSHLFVYFIVYVLDLFSVITVLVLFCYSFVGMFGALFLDFYMSRISLASFFLLMRWLINLWQRISNGVCVLRAAVPTILTG